MCIPDAVAAKFPLVPQYFFVLKTLPVDSLKRVLMVAVCFPCLMRFRLKNMLVSFENSHQNVDGTVALFLCRTGIRSGL